MPVIIVQEIEDGRDKWHDFSVDGIAKDGGVFGVYSFDCFLDDGLFEQEGLEIDFFRSMMPIFHTRDLGGRSGWIWDEEARIWWLCEWIDRRNSVILCRRDYHS